MACPLLELSHSVPPPLAGCRNIGVDDEFWETIGGATSAIYVPKLSDVGRCLPATATYRDSVGNSTLESATGVLEALYAGTPFDTALNAEGGFVNPRLPPTAYGRYRRI